MKATALESGTELERLSMGTKYNSKIKSRLTPFNNANKIILGDQYNSCNFIFQVSKTRRRTNDTNEA